MKFIEVDQKLEKKLIRDSNTFIKGNISRIMIFNENDMNLNNLPLVLHGKDFDLLLVPRTPSDEEMKIINPYLYDGYTKVASVKVI